MEQPETLIVKFAEDRGIFCPLGNVSADSLSKRSGSGGWIHSVKTWPR
jgi:hypothetical protein